MKKSVALILCLVMVLSCLLLTACGSGGKKNLSVSKYLGTWRAFNVSLLGETGEFEDEITLTLNPRRHRQVQRKRHHSGQGILEPGNLPPVCAGRDSSAVSTFHRKGGGYAAG